MTISKELEYELDKADAVWSASCLKCGSLRLIRVDGKLRKMQSRTSRHHLSVHKENQRRFDRHRTHTFTRRRMFLTPAMLFTTWEDNLRAITLSMESLRRVERYGVFKYDESSAAFSTAVC